MIILTLDRPGVFLGLSVWGKYEKLLKTLPQEDKIVQQEAVFTGKIVEMIENGDFDI